MVNRRRKFGRQNQNPGFGGIQQLPEELFLNILCRIPTEQLMRNCRYVCKAWFQLLNLELQNPSFINSNSLYFEPSCIFFGLWPLVVKTADPTGNYSSSLSSRRFKMHDFHDHWLQRRATTSNANPLDKFKAKIRGSSDGVLLIMLRDDQSSFCVVNPLTMQSLKLPRVNHTGQFGVITRIHETGKFKVLTFGKDENESWVWYVITVGLDTSWKILSGLPSNCNPSDSRVPCQRETVSIKGVVYVRFYQDIEDFAFAAVDLHNEVGYWLEIPPYCKSEQQFKYVTKFGRSVSWNLLNIGNKHLGYSEFKKETNAEMKLWVLKDLSRNNEWTLMLRFSLSNPPRTKMVEVIQPRIWFQSSQVMILEVVSGGYSSLFAYFIKKRKFQGLSIGSNYLMHGYSFVPLF